MKISELFELLKRHENRHDEEVRIVINSTSIGGRDYEVVKYAGMGFDWERGLMLQAESQIVRKENNQSIFEAASDLLMMLATEYYVIKRKKYENKRARDILLKYGYTDEQLRKYISLFHRDKELIK